MIPKFFTVKLIYEPVGKPYEAEISELYGKSEDRCRCSKDQILPRAAQQRLRPRLRSRSILSRSAIRHRKLLIISYFGACKKRKARRLAIV